MLSTQCLERIIIVNLLMLLWVCVWFGKLSTQCLECIIIIIYTLSTCWCCCVCVCMIGNALNTMPRRYHFSICIVNLLMLLWSNLVFYAQSTITVISGWMLLSVCMIRNAVKTMPRVCYYSIYIFNLLMLLWVCVWFGMLSTQCLEHIVIVIYC